MKVSRKIFSNIFFLIGPLFKSRKIIEKNLKIFSIKVSNVDKKKIINEMWKNYGKTFIEYIYLDKFRKKKYSYYF